VKGWLILSVIEAARRNGVADLTPKRYVGFKDYPLREHLELLGQAAVRVRPLEAPLRTLRELGRGVYPAFAESLVGKVVLSGLGSGRDGARGGLPWVARVYKMTSNHATATVSELADGATVVELDGVWSFPDTYHVGIFEGAARAFGGDVAVVAKASSLSAATLTVRWVGAEG